MLPATTMPDVAGRRTDSQATGTPRNKKSAARGRRPPLHRRSPRPKSNRPRECLRVDPLADVVGALGQATLVDRMIAFILDVSDP